MIKKVLLVTLATTASASSSPSSSISSSSLRGGQITASIRDGVPNNYIQTATTPDLNCFGAAWKETDAETACISSESSEGPSCVWCSTRGGPDTRGVCLSKDEALVADGQFGLCCPQSDIALGNFMRDMPDINCFKAAWVAENAEDACSSSKSADGKDCVWCSVEGDAEGACLSPDEAVMANGQFGLTCPVKYVDDQIHFVDVA
ncbi:hypothetical protein ACHAXS_013131 [Conticribra weissflogii]